MKNSLDEIPEELLAQMNYQSPIAVNIANDIQLKMEDDIMTAVYSYGVEVDKDELLKALAYDRDQYVTGYADGVRAASPKKGEWVDESIYDAVFIVDGEIRVRQVIEVLCTSCDLYSTFEYGRFHADGNRFCPRCGAAMRGEDDA